MKKWLSAFLFLSVINAFAAPVCHDKYSEVDQVIKEEMNPFGYWLHAESRISIHIYADARSDTMGQLVFDPFFGAKNSTISFCQDGDKFLLKSPEGMYEYKVIKNKLKIASDEYEAGETSHFDDFVQAELKPVKTKLKNK